jgi:ABC-type Fe3+ transport system permease subunit
MWSACRRRGESPNSSTAIYAGLQCVCGVAFNVLFSTIVRQRDDEAFRHRVKVRRRQNLVAVTVYALSALVALFVPILAILLFAAVSLLYVAPTLLDARKTE